LLILYYLWRNKIIKILIFIVIFWKKKIMYEKFFKDKTYIIAEIGGNFNNYNEAIKLIDLAKDCGVDAVKLQTYKAHTIASKNAMFDMENTGKVSQQEMFKKHEIDLDLHKKIYEYANQNNLDFFSTPSHETDVDLLEKLNVSIHKIGSDDAVNLPFLKYVAKTNKIIILSTGMCNLEEIKESVEVIKSQGNNKIVLLHCVTSYPTYAEDVNLSALQTMIKTFPEIPIGYSDHTLDPIASITSVSLGARVVERHFTCDKNAEGPDHILSSDPNEMKFIVDSIRTFEKLKGNGEKIPSKAEKINIINNRKSLILNKSLKKSSVLKKEDLSIKRPGSGIYPKYLEQVIGKKVKADLEYDHILTWSDIE